MARLPRTARALDPVQDAEGHVQRRRGVRSQQSLEREIERTRRGANEWPVPLSRTYPWWRQNLGASGDAAYLCRVGTPSSDAAWAQTSLALRMPAAGRVTGGDLWTSEARTAGTATLRVRITEDGTSTDYDLPDCVLDATTTQTASVAFWEQAPRFAAGATVEARIVTSGTWGPTTADAGVLLAVAFALE